MLARRHLIILPALLLATLLGVAQLFGQQLSKAELSGVITDASGARVPGARVEATHTATQFTRQVLTNDEGFYVISSLPIGPYVLSVELSGFRKYVRSGVNLSAGDRKVIDITLEVGELANQIEVIAEAPLVDRTDATLGVVLERKTIETLPVPGRDFTSLLKLQAGAVIGGRAAYPSASATGGANEPGDLASVSHNGAHDSWNSSNFTMDGVDVSQGESGLIYANSVSIESVDEVSVATSNYSAEEGRAMGGASIKLVTKTGTNDFHGSLFEFYRGNRFQANDFQLNAAGISEPEDFSRHQFGGTLGGPIVKDRLFFFFSYDGIRIKRPALRTRNVLTGAFKSTLDPLLQPFFDVQPEPTTISANDPRLGTVIIAGDDTNNNDVLMPRIDWNLGSHQIFGRWNRMRQGRINEAAGYPGLPQVTEREQDNGAIVWNFFVSPTMTNEFTFGYAYNVRESTQYRGYQAPACPACGRIRVPEIGSPIQSSRTNPRENTIHYLRESFRVVRGNHQFSTGFEFRRMFFSNSELLQPRYRYNNLDDLAANRPIRAENIFGLDPFVQGPGVTPTGALYLQDDWKVNPRLTLNLGLRWDYERPTIENSAKIAGRHPELKKLKGSPVLNCKICTPGSFFIPPDVFDPVNDPFLTRPGDELQQGNYDNLAPRLGFAYDLLGDGKTVLRGGFGIVYFPTGQEAQGAGTVMDMVENSFPGLTIAREDNPALRFPVADFAQAQGALKRFRFKLADQSTAWTRQWNVSVQRELAGSSVVEAAYVGNRSLLRGRFPPAAAGNPFIPDPSHPAGGERVDPCCAFINILGADTHSEYHALQTTFRRSVASGLNLTVFYTWGHAVSEYGENQSGRFFFRAPNVASWPDGPGSQFQIVEKSAGFSDVRHNFLTHWLWQLPQIDHPVLRGWQLSGIWDARTGHPFTISGGSLARNRYRSSSRPNRVPGVPLYTGYVGPDQPYLNKAAFALPPADPEFPGLVLLGDSEQAPIKGPGRWNVDLAVIKNTRIRENHQIQFRAEIFNIFNHVNWGRDLDTNFSSPRFGFMNNPASTSRQIQFGIQYLF